MTRMQVLFSLVFICAVVLMVSLCKTTYDIGYRNGREDATIEGMSIKAPRIGAGGPNPPLKK